MIRRSIFTFVCTLSLLVTGALSASAQMEPSIPSLSNDQVTRLNAGEVIIAVVEGEIPIGEAIGVLNHPPEAVLAVISDFAHYSEYMDDIALSVVDGVEGDITICRGITDTPWPMDDRTWTIRASGGPTQVEGIDVYLSTWTYVEGSGNIVDTTGYWLAIPWGDDGSKTLLRYRLRVDLGTWLPDFLMTWATENFLPERINSIRERTDEIN